MTGLPLFYFVLQAALLIIVIDGSMLLHNALGKFTHIKWKNMKMIMLVIDIMIVIIWIVRGFIVYW